MERCGSGCSVRWRGVKRCQNSDLDVLADFLKPMRIIRRFMPQALANILE